MLSSTAIPRDTNQSKTAYDLVRRLVLKGKRIVADAAYCQHDICETIVEKEADYLVTVKQNQLQLLRDIEQAFVISRSWQGRFVTPRDLVRDSIVIAQFDVTDNPPSAAPNRSLEQDLTLQTNVMSYGGGGTVISLPTSPTQTPSPTTPQAPATPIEPPKSEAPQSAPRHQAQATTRTSTRCPPTNASITTKIASSDCSADDVRPPHTDTSKLDHRKN